jgi:hypothetical protein
VAWARGLGNPRAGHIAEYPRRSGLAEPSPSSLNWLREFKHDGSHLLARRDSEWRLFTRVAAKREAEEDWGHR